MRKGEYNHSEKTKQKMSIKSQLRWQKSEQIQHAREKTKSLWQNPEYRKHQVEVHKKRWQDPEYSNSMSEAHKGNIPSLETRKKMSKAHLRNPTRYWLDKHPSEEAKEKVRLAQKAINRRTVSNKYAEIDRQRYLRQAKKVLEEYYGIPWEQMHKLARAAIHHINGDEADNRFDNLCVMSPEDHNHVHWNDKSIMRREHE